MSASVDPVLRQGVISSRAMLKPEPREILVRRLPSVWRRWSARPSPLSSWMRGGNRRGLLPGRGRGGVGRRPWLVCDLTQFLLVPNVSPNWAETHERQQTRLQELKPVYFKVKRARCWSGRRAHYALHWSNCRPRPDLPRSGVLIFLGLFFCLVVLLGSPINWPGSRCGAFPPVCGPDFCGGPAPGQHLDEQGVPGAGDNVSRGLPRWATTWCTSCPGWPPSWRHVPGLETGWGGLSQRHLRGPGGG